jgi:hypothetical protein
MGRSRRVGVRRSACRAQLNGSEKASTKHQAPEALCHEMAKQNSPGLQPWVRSGHEIALKVATDKGERLTDVASLKKRSHYLYVLGRYDPFRAPLSGRFFDWPYPGLKPWATLFCHFMAGPASRRHAHSPSRRYAYTFLP